MITLLQVYCDCQWEN